MVVVYGPAMKSWLMLQMANDPDLEIAMGLDVHYLNRSFSEILKLCGQHIHIPTSLELELAIELELRESGLSDPSLSHYLRKNDSQPYSRKSERRIISLSEELAKLFYQYGRFGRSLLQNWKDEWQGKIWSSIFQKHAEWKNLIQALESPLTPTQNVEIHFFSISYLTPTEFSFLKRLASQIKVNYYLLSPCAVFWSDIRSDKERITLIHRLQKQEKPHAQIEELEEYLRDCNPLLANFGRMGREMVTQIEENQVELELSACYQLPAGIHVNENDFVSEDLIQASTSETLSLLHSVQADILLMRNSTQVTQFPQQDLSIQLHSTPTLQREVEILYNNLLSILNENRAISPHDVLILAPEIQDYLPYIQMIFGREDSLLDYQILDADMTHFNNATKGFLQLLHLADSRWDVKTLLELVSHPSFKQKHTLSDSDVGTLRKWIEAKKIYWGLNSEHRDEVLKRQHCDVSQQELSEQGTWEKGLDALLKSISSFSKKLHDGSIDFTQGELLSKWSGILKGLVDDLKPFLDETKMSIKGWIFYLNCLIDCHFAPTDENSQTELTDLKNQLKLFENAASSVEEELFSFISIKLRLQKLLHEERAIYREHHLQAVRFCSMVPLRSIPAKVIAMMGMQEGAFPRTHQRSSFDLLDKIKSEYVPKSVDFDRYLFLEVLHSARNYLLLSFQGFNHELNQENSPSLVVQELFSYLDKHYLIHDENPSVACLYKHPLSGMHPSYFTEASKIKNHSTQDYSMAIKFCQENKTSNQEFLQIFRKAESPISLNIVELKHLVTVAKHPIRFYLQQVVGIKRELSEDRQLQVEENLEISPLDRYILKKKGLTDTPEEILSFAAEKQLLPFGRFKSVAEKKLVQELNELSDNKKNLSLFNIEFRKGCSCTFQASPQLWVFPAIQLKSHRQIVGTVRNVSNEGLVLVGKGSFANIWKSWPEFLAYSVAAEEKGWAKQWIFTDDSEPKQSFFQDSLPYLEQFLDYYSHCLNACSPLMPDWIPFFLKEDSKGLQRKMEEMLSEMTPEYQKHEWKWLFPNGELPNSQELLDEWKNEASALANELLTLV